MTSMKYFIDEIKKNNDNPAKGIGSKTYCKEFYEKIGNIQKKKIYLYGASSKVGKTTFVDYIHILVPYIEGYRNIKYYYYGWEINISDKMAGFAAFFMKHDYNIDMDAETVLGISRKLDEQELSMITNIYATRLRDLFGDYDENGELISEGIIEYIEDRLTPEGFKDEMERIADKHGEIGMTKKNRKYYIWNNVKQHVHIIVDHIGKVDKRKSFTKEAIDKLTDWCVVYRNLCHFSFILISQFNRGLTAIDRRGLMEELIKPEKTDFKDSSNGAEDCDFLFALFNPLLLADLDTIKINGKSYKLRKAGALVIDAGFRGFYCLEARREHPFEMGMFLKNNYVEF